MNILKEPVGEDLRKVERAINDNCFNNELNQIPMRFMAADDFIPITMYKNGDMLINKAYYDIKGLNKKLIHEIFHAMIHAYCELHGIQDTDGDLHLEEFADECDRHGGFCAWINSQYGYGNVGIQIKKMKRIKADITQKGA